jgi:molecular chaperone GrpE
MSKKRSDDQPEQGADLNNKNQASVPVELLTHPSYQEMLQKLDDADQKSNQYWERILRMQAEADNMQRRIERDVGNAHKYALEKFVAELIPIVDSLELCKTSVPVDMRKAAEAVIEGVDLTLKMFYAAMEKFGVKQVNPVSEPFNPELHQAISMQVDAAVKPGTVISVLQKGYTLNNRLIRPALVVVSKVEE